MNFIFTLNIDQCGSKCISRISFLLLCSVCYKKDAAVGVPRIMSIFLLSLDAPVVAVVVVVVVERRSCFNHSSCSVP